MINSIYNHLIGSTESAAPTPTFPTSKEGEPRVALDLDIDTFSTNLGRAAVFAKALWEVGDGRYDCSHSVLKPILADFETHNPLTASQIQNLSLRLDAISPNTRIKYKAPLNNLRSKLDEGAYRLSGNESSQSIANRVEFQDFLNTLTRESAPLSSNELSSILRYKEAGGSRFVNDALRGVEPLSHEALIAAKFICSGLSKLRPHTEVVYRGAGCLIGNAEFADVGNVYTEPAFISTTGTPGAAFRGEFQIAIHPKNSFFDISTIVDPNDMNSVNCSHFEDEVLGLPGTKLEYLGEDDGRHWYKEV